MMQFLTVIATMLVLIAAMFGYASLVWYLRYRPTPALAPVMAGDGRQYPQHPSMLATSRYHTTPTPQDTGEDRVNNDMSDGIIVLDNQRRIIDINQVARQILQPAAKLAGETIDDVLPVVAKHMRADQSRSLDIVLGDKASERFYELAVSPFFDGRGRQRGHLLLLHDVTDRRKLETMRDDVTRTMVHDLRDPISNSLFALEMLKTSLADSGSAEAQQLLDLTFANTAKTLQLVDKILEIGRLESGRNPPGLYDDLFERNG